MGVQKDLQVVENTWWGIAGGHNIDLVVVYNAACQDFIDVLPSETQEELAKGSAGDFARYPYYRTEVQNSVTRPLELTAQQVNLLAAQAEYVVTQNAAVFQTLLN